MPGARGLVFNSWFLALGKQLLDRLAAVHDLDRPADAAKVLLVRVDLEGLAEGAEQVGHAHRPLGHVGAGGVGRADDPAAPANRAAWATISASQTPMLVAFSDGDPMTGAMAPILQRRMPGAQGIEHPVIANAGHFLQEDAGEELANRIVEFLR